jgi:SAM-dependent methyltransferase
VGDSWFEVAFGPLYPLIYGHRDQAEARRCLHLLQSLLPLGPSAHPVLDLGCGDGRHLELLKASGIHAVGLDLSGTLLELGKKRNSDLMLVRGDMRHLCFPANSLASVLSLFTAFGYFGPLETNAPVVSEISRVLLPGGHWVLDYFNCDRVIDELGSGDTFPRERNVGSFSILETRRYCPQEKLVFKDVLVKALPSAKGDPETLLIPENGLRYTEQVAVFSLEEMDTLALAHGFQRTASSGSYTGTTLDQGDRWILVYRKDGG